MISPLIVTLILVSSILDKNGAQIGFSNLTTIGVIPGKDYGLKISGPPSTQLLVIKLIPNVDNITSCVEPAVTSYKGMLNRILLPISESLNRTRNAIKDREILGREGENFWGAVVGGIALGIATSAQITAGVALHNSLRNARDIQLLRSALRHTNSAIAKLQTSQQRTVTAINALQSRINSQIIPAIDHIGCEQARISFSLQLTEYFSELSLVFGPNLQNPSTTTITLQALSRAFNDDFSAILETLGYEDEDVLDILESGSIKGRIIDVSVEDYYIAMQLEYPTITKIPDARVQEFDVITHTVDNHEWQALFPRHLLVRGGFIASIEISDCSLTSQNVICSKDYSYPLGPDLEKCARGMINKCTRTRIINGHAPRYTLSMGVIYANCFHIHCRCTDPSFNINHDPSVANIMITADFCRELVIDSIYITVGERKLNRSTYAQNEVLLRPVSVAPIDIGNEIVQIQESLNQSMQELEVAQSILNKVSPGLISTMSLTLMISGIGVIGVSVLALIVWVSIIQRRIAKLDYERRHLLFANQSAGNKISTYGTWEEINVKPTVSK
uniref:Fusion glycoprotein F0 n=1 Tax=Eozapus setchuanus jeilongvirus TaxID=3028506 RepID=A0AAT9TSI9_9MONO|nr:MAG: fusion protein [Eozapus setchuanus jeilongvirus]